MDWDFLEKALLKWGFSGTWVSRIMECVKSVKYSVKFNGKLLAQFTPTRGLRQGDPLPPFLFLFVADALLSLLHKAIHDDGLEELKICRRAPDISHLLFADDTLLFFHESSDQATIGKGGLNTYAEAMGQLINPTKCSILFADNCTTTISNEVKSILGVTQEVFEPKYLGLLVPEGRMSKGKLEPLQAKLSKRLVDWSERYMSMASKEVLIKAVAQSIPTYTFGCFDLTKEYA